MSQHTPGPWEVMNPPKSRFFGVHAKGHAVASRIEVRDDARLIAAAPRMRAALQVTTDELYRLAMKAPDLNPKVDRIISEARALLKEIDQ